MEKKGVIYILTNPSFPGYVKIGYADDIDKRLQQLNRSEFLIRKSNRQEFCDSEECQRTRNARKQMVYRKRKAGNVSENKRKQRKAKE